MSNIRAPYSEAKEYVERVYLSNYMDHVKRILEIPLLYSYACL